jgi:hypothetical protein
VLAGMQLAVPALSMLVGSYSAKVVCHAHLAGLQLASPHPGSGTFSMPDRGFQGSVLPGNTSIMEQVRRLFGMSTGPMQCHGVV